MPTSRKHDSQALADEVQSLRSTVQRLRKFVCPRCSESHLLDSGKVWGLCGLVKLIGKGFDEADVARMIAEGK